MRRWVLLIVVVLAVLLGLLVGMLNGQLVTLDVLLTTMQASLGLVVMIAFVTGLLLGVLSLWILRVLPLQFRVKRLQREAQQSSRLPATGSSGAESINTKSTNRLSG